MALKQRYQNPVVNDTVRLKLFVYNSNNFADVNEIQEINIYKVEDGKSINDVSARVLVQTISGSDVIRDDTGKYYVDVVVTEGTYTIGKYVDVWSVEFSNSTDSQSTITNVFQIYPDLWYTTPIPVVYDFNFQFRPARLRKGSKRYIIIEVMPNVPKGTDLERYYENLAIVGDLLVSVEQISGECLPQEQDLRLIVDKEAVDYREKRFGYYQIDTSSDDFPVGLYNIWFELDLGENTYISERYAFQIFD